MLLLERAIPEYASRPGVGAGTPSGDGFAVALGFLPFNEDELGGITDILQNSVGNTGWRLGYGTSVGSSILRVELGRSDGTLFTQTVSVSPIAPTFCLLILFVQGGTDPEVHLALNGNTLLSTTLGAGLSYAPAAGQSLVMRSTDVSFLGAGYATGTFADELQFSETRRLVTMNVFSTGRFSTPGGFFGALGLDFGHFNNAWDTQSLLNSGLHVANGEDRALAGVEWEPCLFSGAEILTNEDNVTRPFFYNMPVSMASPALVP